MAVILLGISLVLSLGAARSATAAPSGRAAPAVIAEVTAPRAVAAPGVMIAPRVTAHVTSAVRSTALASIPRWHAYLWALSRGGDWYVWGGAGPSVFDCSGLVVWAYARVGIWLPHNTGAMLYSGKLQWEPSWKVRPGDLAFFGSGHVELVTGIRNVTFGAQNQGTRVGFHWGNAWWHPSAYYRVSGAG